MAILDGSIVNVALPKMMAIFNVSTDKIQWVSTAYMLALGITIPISGFLGDNFGYKKTYIFALAVFVLGSTLCGMAWSPESIVGARIIQAVGGGIMQPLGMAMIYKSFPRSKIGMVLGIWGIASMAAPAVGPTLGGYLVEYSNWRLIFFINLPIGILNLYMAANILKETALVKVKHFDYWGVILSTVGLFCLLLALSEGNNEGWTSPYIVSLFAVAVICLTAMITNELQHPEPILDLRLFKNLTFTLTTIIGSLIAIGMFGAIFLVPILLQSVLGQTAMKTGIIMFPAALASGFMMPISGRLFDKYGAKGVAIVGLGIVAWTTYMMKDFNALTPFVVMTMWLVVRGLGMGLCMMPVTTAGMNTVSPELIGRASALGNVIRQVASSFGIAMFTSVMANRQVFHLANLAGSVNTDSNAYLSIQATLRNMAVTNGLSTGAVQGLGLSTVYAQIVKSSMVSAITDCFILATAMCCLALVLILFLKEKRQPHLVKKEMPEPGHLVMET